MTSTILVFNDKAGRIVYNPTIPFVHDGRKYIGARVEPLKSELDSQTVFAYEQKDNPDKWCFDDAVPPLPLQDPAYMAINGKKVVVGVKVQQGCNETIYRSDFYVSDSIEDLEHFTSGPIGMKDIRLVNLEGRIGVFTRPLGKTGGKGKIGYFEVGDLDELRNLSEEDWFSARIIGGLFDDNHWGGANQALRLSQDEIGVIGHIAYGTTNEKGELVKHYRGMSFRFNPKTQTHDKFRIIATRKDFPSSGSKKSPELDDVVFPAGIDDSGSLYCGISDFCVGRKTETNPF